MRACPQKCLYLLLGVSCLIILTIIYGQYHDLSIDRPLSVSWQRDEDSGWTEEDVWNITPATQEETVGLLPRETMEMVMNKPNQTKPNKAVCSLSTPIRKSWKQTERAGSGTVLCETVYKEGPAPREAFQFLRARAAVGREPLQTHVGATEEPCASLRLEGDSSRRYPLPVHIRIINNKTCNVEVFEVRFLVIISSTLRSSPVVRSTLALLNGSHSGRLFERRSPDQCVRCAVVGNGGILRGSKQGRAIDSHDLVFRVNGAVTKGFEEDVGTKISFYGFTTNTMKHSLKLYRRDGFTKVPQGPEIRYIFIPSNIRDYVMMAAAIRGQTVTTGYDAGDWPPRYFGTRPPEHFKMLHPDFITYVTHGFLKSPLMSLRATGHLYMPSTGALMLMTALHTCDQVSAYGFITRNYADFSTHYYDSVRTPLKFYANHDMKMEGWLWEALDLGGVMRLYQRAANS